MKIHVLNFSLALALLGATIGAPAQTLEYELSGTLSGTFNGTDFEDSPFLITMIGNVSDVAEVQAYRLHWYALGDLDTTNHSVHVITNTPLSGPVLSVDGVGSSTAQGYVYTYRGGLAVGDNNNGNWLFLIIGSTTNGTEYQLKGEWALSSPTISSSQTSLTINGDIWSNLSWSDITFSATEVVPEPSTLALAGLGVVSLLLHRRRFLRQKSM